MPIIKRSVPTKEIITIAFLAVGIGLIGKIGGFNSLSVADVI